MMTIEELIEYYNEHQLSDYEFNKKEHREFKKELKRNLSYIEDLKGEKKLGLYINALLNGYHNSPPPCEVCGKPVIGVRKAEFNKYCSKECTAIGTVPKMHETTKKRYGGLGSQSEIIRNKVKKTNLEKYGVPSFFHTKEFKETDWITPIYGVPHNSQSEEIQRRKKENRIKKMTKEEYEKYLWNQMTVEERWGESHPMKTDEGKKRLKDSLLRNHGVDNPMYVDGVMDKIVQTNIERYGVPHYTQTEEFKKRISEFNNSVDKFIRDSYDRDKETVKIIKDKEKLQSLYNKHKTITNLSEVLSINPTTLGRILKHHGIEIEQHHRKSGIEYALVDYIKDLGIDDIVENDRRFGYEIDIFLPKFNVAIEVNGVHWHSELFKPKNYHAEKTNKMINDGLRQLHVWEHHWNCTVKREIVKNRIKFMLGLNDCRVFARKTDIVYPKTSVVMNFYEKTHIQGKKGGTKNIALSLDGEIVAAMTLTDKKNGLWYLERYSTKGQVVGGFSKLFKHFLSETDGVKEVQTHASLDYSQGKVYVTNVFEQTGVTPPNYSYHKSGKHFSRNQCMKHKLHKILENFDETLSEVQNMHNHGFFRVYDSGSLKFSYYNT